jgi:hypothetical protein
MPIFGSVQTLMQNVKDYGAVGDGIADDTVAINAALALGGIWWLPIGTYSVSGSLNIPKNNTKMVGAGYGTIIQPSASFVAAQIINVTGSYCSVSDMQITGAHTSYPGSYSANPIGNGIQITGSVGSIVENVFLNAINGWTLQSTGGTVTPNYNTVLKNVRGYQCKNGFHLQGVAASGYGGIHFVSDCYSNQTQVGDGWFIEDFLDLEAVNIFSEGAAVIGNSGYALHIKGNSNALFFTNCDLGPYPGPGGNHVVLIESGTNGNPGHITFNGGIIEGGQGGGLTITAGFDIIAQGVYFFNNGTYGVDILGGNAIMINNCTFDFNGTTGTSGKYEIQNTSTSNIMVNGCFFMTPQGTTPGTVNAVINDIGSTSMVVTNCYFKGTGFTSANIFASYPLTIRGCVGFNPVGNLGAPSIGASPYTAPTQSVDYTAYIKGGTVSAIAVNGFTTGLTVATGGFVTVHVMSGQTITLTYSVIPTWTWLGE